MKQLVGISKALMWLTQLAINVAVPLFLFVYGAVFLREKLSCGVWILFIGIILGLLGAAGGLKNSFKAMGLIKKSPAEEDKHPVAFNTHK